jgi:hypothetical protein
MGKEPTSSVTTAYIEPGSGRVLKIHADGSILIIPGWEKPVTISGGNITVPTFCNVSSFPKSAPEPSSHTPSSQAASDHAKLVQEDAFEAVQENERHGSSQHVPELPPRARSAPPRVGNLPATNSAVQLSPIPGVIMSTLTLLHS